MSGPIASQHVVELHCVSQASSADRTVNPRAGSPHCGVRQACPDHGGEWRARTALIGAHFRAKRETFPAIPSSHSNDGHGLATYLLNSALVAIMTVVGTLVVSTTAGYAFARFRFPGKNLLAVPCVILFLFLQRGDVRGFMSGSLKG